MKNKTSFLLALAILLALLAYSAVYQVRFTESAVVTTFGRADEQTAARNASPDADEAGLYFKWPWPVQEVRVYDKRVQIVEDRLEEQQTLDKQGVVVNAYVAWRIVDPLNFFRSLQDMDNARNHIRARLRDCKSIIGNYTMDDLTHADPAKLRIDQVEQEILRKLRDDAAPAGRASLPLGVEFQSVGIKRLVLPGPVTEKVFEHMRSTRQRLAQSARSEGEATAADITARAESARQMILAFAERQAQAIRARGDQAAAAYYPVFKQDENLAVFLREMDAARAILPHNTTFLIDAKDGLKGLFTPPAPSATPAPAPEKP
jgi:membrane protease subunit HflC